MLPQLIGIAVVEPKSTNSIILLVRSFTFRPNYDMGPIIYLCNDTVVSYNVIHPKMSLK